MKTLLLVDPYVSINYTYEFTQKNNLGTIVLFLNKEHASINKVYALGYDHFIVSSGEQAKDIRTIETILKKTAAELLYVLAGSDDSSVYAEALLNRLLPIYGNSDLARFRINKFEMIQHLKKNQLSQLQQCIVHKQSFEKDFKTVQEFSYPVILKPNQHASGQAETYKANSPAELHQHIKKSFSQKHIRTNRAFDEFVVQQYIKGNEYCVDTVSFNKQHFVCGIYAYKKRGLDVIFVEPVLISSPHWETLANYTQAALNSLDFNTGINHTEMILKKTGSIELIEINPRVSGGHSFIQKMAKTIGWMDQLEAFYRLLSTKKVLTPQNLQSNTPLFTRCVCIHSDLKELLKQTLHSKHVEIIYENPMNPTTLTTYNSLNLTGIIQLTDDNLSNLEHDTKKLRP